MIFIKKYAKGNTLKLDPNHKPKLPQELEHSRQLDVHKWSDFKDVNGFIDVIWNEFFLSSYPDNVRAGVKVVGLIQFLI